ncbi:uncharacterized protein F5147DRAFT_659138 [Suillus discolor]|uniref:CxC2-like cysteine cluster KDZ transposase-associated domain-containing protein n=1 Tax=Suillus discolor TaxID=1912936 RepID=A0A9P7ESI1_9AGAM|nr:uncharacterized protein F5147DRAFT_659138 [Suillus discolor]KAG2086762.1 hypothetical protein F5147DRAFT_659138 [Suillus discolor]
MKGSTLQEWTPKQKYAVVEWQKSYRTRMVVGKWVERPMISQSVLATPIKSASKQPSHDMLHHGGDDFLGELDDHRVVIPLHLPKSLSQNDYIRQWVPKTKAYLEILLEREVPSDRSCIICGPDGVYKCHGCFGSFFEESCLVKSGIVIWLGHDGKPCPWDDNVEDSVVFTTGEDGANTTDMESTSEDGAAPFSKNADDLPTGVPFIKGNSSMTTIVDKSGIHTHMVKYCTCPNATTANIQMFKMGLFPASFLEPKTAFTFDVLNDFLLDNLECRTSAMNYYSKLRRMTMTIFPHLVPDRYWELMRVARQWRKLKLLKWNGFDHEEKEVKPGDLALFCLACPQPGINVTLPVRELTEDPNVNKGSDLQTPSWLYTRSLVMDGNFKAEHLHAVNPGDEVSLMDGRGFMVGDALYKEHLAIAQDTVQQSECNNHRAVNQANASRHRLEATGISGCTCARHGCFVPHTMVDFQEGERQMNMDYALCEALKINADGIRCALTFYDVNCQYHKHLKDRIAESPILEICEELNIIPGIGLWHVHGHQDSFYVRYASNFIKGAAWIDGEIMETLWNECHTGKSLCKKYNKAVRGTANSKLVFEKLDETADPVKVWVWEAQERVAHQRRRHDPTAMDIYEVQLQKASRFSSNYSADKKAAGNMIVSGTRAAPRAYLAMGCCYMAVRGIGSALSDDEDLSMEPDLIMLEEDSDAGIEQQPKSYQPEKVVIPLPSNLGQDTCTAFGIDDLVKQELILREGQANDALQNIRVHLADKAVIFQKTVQVAKSQATSTRAWAQVHSVDRAVSIQASIYLKCRKQLCSLGADDALLRRYQALAKDHLKRNDMLPWFWSLDVAGDSEGSDWLNEFYWVHWLRAKALKDRWAEEILLVQHEMDWTCTFFLHKAEEWKRLGVIAKAAQKQAHMAYAGRQGNIYECLLEEARQAFDRTTGKILTPVMRSTVNDL